MSILNLNNTIIVIELIGYARSRVPFFRSIPIPMLWVFQGTCLPDMLTVDIFCCFHCTTFQVNSMDVCT